MIVARYYGNKKRKTERFLNAINCIKMAKNTSLTKEIPTTYSQITTQQTLQNGDMRNKKQFYCKGQNRKKNNCDSE